jgi:hypothetical protein
VNNYKEKGYGDVYFDHRIPDRITHELDSSFIRFGVIWNGGHGYNIGAEQSYSFITGPYCPKCHGKMEEKDLGLIPQPYWVCSSCDFDVKRKNRHYPNEYKAIENMVDNKIIKMSKHKRDIISK